MSNMSIRLDNNSYAGLCATIVNGVEKYRTQASLLGIGLPPNVNIAAIWGKTFSGGSGSAPMFKYLLKPMSPANYFNGFLKDILDLTSDCLPLLNNLLPDIIIPQKKGFDYEKITSTTLHELTHAAHAKKAGRLFWVKVVSGEVTNMINGDGSYGKRNGSFAKEIALAEAWANDVENIMMYRLFGNASIYISREMENWYSKNNKDVVAKWLPNGIFYDLYDTNYRYGISERSVVDNVSGISWNQMYSNLGGTTDNISNYKNRLKSRYSTKASGIEALFSEYAF